MTNTYPIIDCGEDEESNAVEIEFTPDLFTDEQNERYEAKLALLRTLKGSNAAPAAPTEKEFDTTPFNHWEKNRYIISGHNVGEVSTPDE